MWPGHLVGYSFVRNFDAHVSSSLPAVALEAVEDVE